jgi:hypothetical protein
MRCIVTWPAGWVFQPIDESRTFHRHAENDCAVYRLAEFCRSGRPAGHADGCSAGLDSARAVSGEPRMADGLVDATVDNGVADPRPMVEA